ncbi:MAG: helix-turn-helix transcriptional regulator [Planctomycetaceae bacterium]|nr:helix-turn-helix transcriptional regulator [Planctomycetaceae bacterium]
MPHQIVTSKGQRFVMVPVAEWRRVEHLTAKTATPIPKLPARPKGDQDGNLPALAYIQVSIARDVLRERTALRLTQQQLAKLAGVREETLSRLESGKHSPTVRTVEKIERALQKAKRREKLEDDI